MKEFAGEESARFDAGRIVGVRRGAGCHNFALGAAVLVKLANCGEGGASNIVDVEMLDDASEPRLAWVSEFAMECLHFGKVGG